MELIDNKNKTLLDDLSVEIKKGSKLSIAAACFSIYAFQVLREQLTDIDELRFIFTAPTFATERRKKKAGSFIFLVCLGRKAFMAPSLRSSCAMN